MTRQSAFQCDVAQTLNTLKGKVSLFLTLLILIVKISQCILQHRASLTETLLAHATFYHVVQGSVLSGIISQQHNNAILFHRAHIQSQKNSMFRVS